MSQAQPPYLGPLAGNFWHQYTNSAGQVYYHNPGQGTTQFNIPQGFEDHPQDTWPRDNTKSWPQWNNSRTGRSILIDPNPPPPTTYLDLIAVRAHINTLERVPDSLEHMYRRPMAGILRFCFPESEGYDIVQETSTETTVPDFTSFKILCRPGGTLYSYEVLLVESKTNKGNFANTEPQCEEHARNCTNESKNTYAMIQCGLLVCFYRHLDGKFERISGEMHLVSQAQMIQDFFTYIKENPLSLVK